MSDIKEKCVPTITNLQWMFKTYVGESREEYENVIAEKNSLVPRDDDESKTMRSSFVSKKRSSRSVTPKEEALFPPCSSRAVFIIGYQSSQVLKN